MNQKTAERISESILDWRNGESILLIEEPFESAEISKAIDKPHIGLRITFAVPKRANKLTCALKKIIEALETVAFTEEKNVDYIEVVRIKADSIKEAATAVEVIELVEKRSAWLTEEQ